MLARHFGRVRKQLAALAVKRDFESRRTFMSTLRLSHAGRLMPVVLAGCYAGPPALAVDSPPGMRSATTPGAASTDDATAIPPTPAASGAVVIRAVKGCVSSGIFVNRCTSGVVSYCVKGERLVGGGCDGSDEDQQPHGFPIGYGPTDSEAAGWRCRRGWGPVISYALCQGITPPPPRDPPRALPAADDWLDE
jgi:hypothetical protein